MARPSRNTVDYFPFLCKEGKTMYFIEKKYKNDGYAVWVKILRELAVNDYHYLDLNDTGRIMFIAAKCNVDEDILIKIIDDLCSLGEFHKTLWKENQIIFSEKFIINIQDAYKKRSNECVTLESLLQHLSDLDIRKLYKPLKSEVKETPSIKNEIKKQAGITSPPISIVDVYLRDLPNSEELSKISQMLGVDKTNLLLKLPAFKKYMNLEYKSFKDFAQHFKNWYLKDKAAVNENYPTKTLISFGKKNK